jgi:hypothetical protein
MNAFQKRGSLYESCPSSKRRKVILCRGNAGSICPETLLDLRLDRFPRMIGRYESRWHLIANMSMQQSHQCGLSAAWGPSNLWKRLLSHGRRYQCKTHTWTSFSLSNISYNWCTVSDRGLQKAKERRLIIQGRLDQSDPLTRNRWNRFVGWWN